MQEISLEPEDPKRFRVWEQMVLKYQLRQDGNWFWKVPGKEKRARAKTGVNPCVLNTAQPLGWNGWSGLGKGSGIWKIIQCVGSGICNEEHSREFPYRNKGTGGGGGAGQGKADLGLGING